MTLNLHKTSFLIHVIALAGTGLFACALPAQTPAWFPLEVGNTWLYRPAPTNRTGPDQYRTISVHGTENIAGRDYFDVSYFGRELVLRVEPSTGSVIQYDRTSNSEMNFLSLGLPAGSTFPTTINPCPTTGEIAGRDLTVATPAGQFANAVQVTFKGNCVDVGVTQQFYAPYIGLLTDEETSFGGGLKYDLVYYSVGSSAGTAQELSFTVGVDAAQYTAGSTMQTRVTLRSTSRDPIYLHFPSGQSYELKIFDAAGNVVYLWSKGKAFTMIVRNETFGPGERTYGLAASLDGLPAGHYTAEAYLTTDPVMYKGQVSFDIVPGQNVPDANNSAAGVVKDTASPVIGK